jgi:Fe2+ transport system protein FeoA
MSTTLAHLPLGRPARIESVAGERAFRRRLLELGFLPGVEVTLVGVAPLGDPLEIEVRGCRFSLRKAEAEVIAVEDASTVMAAK